MVRNLSPLNLDYAFPLWTNESHRSASLLAKSPLFVSASACCCQFYTTVAREGQCKVVRIWRKPTLTWLFHYFVTAEVLIVSHQGLSYIRSPHHCCHCCVEKFISGVESREGRAWCRRHHRSLPFSHQGWIERCSINLYSSGLPAVRNEGECLFWRLLSTV